MTNHLSDKEALARLNSDVARHMQNTTKISNALATQTDDTLMRVLRAAERLAQAQVLLGEGRGAEALPLITAARTNIQATAPASLADLVAQFKAPQAALEASLLQVVQGMQAPAPVPAPAPAPSRYVQLGTGRLVSMPTYADKGPTYVLDSGGQAHESANNDSAKWRVAAAPVPAGGVAPYGDMKGSCRRLVTNVPGAVHGRATYLRMSAGDATQSPTGTAEGFWQLAPMQSATFVARYGIVSPPGEPAPAWGRQHKIGGGLAMWDRVWAAFPGGNRGSAQNCSFRTNIYYDRDLKRAYHHVYLYGGPGLRITDSHRAAVYSRSVAGGLNLDVRSGVEAKLGEMYTVVVQVTAGAPGTSAGSLQMHINGVAALNLTGIRWTDAPRKNSSAPGQGWNFALLANMMGGTDRVLDVPQNPSKTNWYRLEAFDVYAGAQLGAVV